MRYDVTLPEIKRALEENNSNAGAQFIVKNGEQYIVRSVGLAEKIPDLERIVLKTIDGTPVYLNQVADVVIGGATRFGLTDHGRQGRSRGGHGAQAHRRRTPPRSSPDVKTRLAEINKILPAGRAVVPYYDQATLVAKCVHTVIKALYEAVILVVLIQLIMMGGLRPSIVVLAPRFPSRSPSPFC